MHAQPLLGIVTALHGEARAAGARRAPPGVPVPLARDVLLIRCGIGRAAAAAAARELVEAGASALLSWGTAAALEPGLARGHLALPHEVVSREGRRLPVDAAWRRALAGVAAGAGAGSLAEAGEVLGRADDKARLRAVSGAAVADMESAAVAEQCRAAGIAFLAVRAVSDDAHMGVPACARAAVRADGDISAIGCLARLARTPWELPGLLRLGAGFRRACAALSALEQRAGPRFHLPGVGEPQA